VSKRILVVEDQPDNRQIIRDMLAPTNYEITEAENGEQALAAIAKQRPDHILMDIQLPIMDGYMATSRIKSDPTGRSRSLLSLLTRSAAKRRRPERPAAMTMCRDLSVRDNCWRKFVSSCNSGIKRRRSGSSRRQPRLAQWGRLGTVNLDYRRGGRLYHILSFSYDQQQPDADPRSLQQFVKSYGRGPFLTRMPITLSMGMCTNHIELSETPAASA
jgi:CheY-like chemotaxis protein